LAKASWLYVVASAPYRDRTPSDPAFDAIMASGAFGQLTSVVLTGAGLAYLDPLIEPPEGCTDLRKHLRALPLYDVDTLYVTDAPSGKTPLADDLSIELISHQAFKTLMAEATHTVVFP
jgi:sulfur relay (sulfurtransferase) DsrF/TusC family protein